MNNSKQFTRWNGLIEKIKNEKSNSAEQIRSIDSKTAPAKNKKKGD